MNTRLRGFLGGVCWLIGLALPLSFAHLSSAAEPVIIKSPNDRRDYRYLQLDNGLRVVLVSEDGADRAAASLQVAVGSGDDPPERPGLAHFLEHMLFLGTDKFPIAGEYQDFVVRAGGSQNAFTAFDRTNYHFEVDAGSLAATLERFARFFVAPRMDADLVERERQAVHAEFTSNLKNDGRRSLAALKQALNPQHPLAKFAVGSEQTLADHPDDAVRDDLIAFYKRHYHAANMTLSVLGGESLDTLQRWVQREFSEVPTGRVGVLKTPPLFSPRQLPARLDVVPEREGRSLSLSFPIPAVQSRYRVKPTYLLAHLLGDEGEGSLLSLLRARGLANSLSAGSGYSHAEFATFMVTLGLTENGLARLEEVVESIFATLALIRKEGLKQWRYDELQRLSALDFRFMEQADPGGLTRALANNLVTYEVPDLLRGAYALDNFDDALARRYLHAMRPDNMLVTVVAPGLQTNAVAPYYDTPYALRPLDPDWVKTLGRVLEDAAPEATASTERTNDVRADKGPGRRQLIGLPERNPFVPEDVTLLVDQSGHSPTTLSSEPGLRLWHLQDTSFGVPQASFFVSLRTAKANATARASILTNLFVSMVNEQLREMTYPAALAGLGVQIYKHMRGISFRISGYSDKQHELVAPVMQALRDPALPSARFARVRARLRRALSNQRLASPYSQAMAAVGERMLERRYSIAERLRVLEGLEVADLAAFAPTLLTDVDVVALAHGNVTDAQALALAARLRQQMQHDAGTANVASPRVRRLQRGSVTRIHLAVDHADQALVIYLQGKRRSDKDSAVTALLAQILSSPFYDELRTRQQLGYIVFASSMPMMRVPGLALVVQSPKVDSVELELLVEEFVRSFVAQMAAMPAAEFAEHRDSLVTRLREQDKTQGERTNRLWVAINRDAGRFDRFERLAEIVSVLKLADVQGALAGLTDAASRAALVLHARRGHGNQVATEQSLQRPAQYFD